jgi:hypothetical protein
MRPANELRGSLGQLYGAFRPQATKIDCLPGHKKPIWGPYFNMWLFIFIKYGSILGFEQQSCQNEVASGEEIDNLKI